MDRQTQIWKSLGDPEYRREFSNDIGTGLAFQIRALREEHGWTQDQLADRTGKRQETISQWENPNYGKYTLTTLKALATAFDVALVVRFAPFSELVDWTSNITPARLAPASFAEDRLTRGSPQESFVSTTTSFTAALPDQEADLAMAGTTNQVFGSAPGQTLAEEELIFNAQSTFVGGRELNAIAA